MVYSLWFAKVKIFVDSFAKRFLTGFIVFLTLFIAQAQATLFVTGDIDLRYKNIGFKKDEFELHLASLSLRKVFADKMGDRVILFLLAETMHNFKETMIDQGYLQYKGPLGKWNVTLGRYRLPFGLLPNYSTERLLIRTLEDETIGISSDNGLQLSGTIEDYDYAISLSQGVGTAIRAIDIDKNGLLSFRVGYQGGDFEDLRIGISGLAGKITLETHNDPAHSGMGGVDKKLLGIDLIKYSGPLVWRGELSFGEENDKTLLGIFLGADYALLPKLELNTAYASIRKGSTKNDSLTIGLTYNLFPGYQVRIAQKLGLGGEENELSIQVYYIFNRSF